MSQDPQSRVAIVTGAAGGIGKAACRRLLAGGWSVVAADLDATRLSWADGVANILTVAADVTTEAGNAEMVRVAVEAFGRLDAILLNAAMPMSGSIEETSMEAFDQVLAVNVKGPVMGVKAALPHLRRSRGVVLVTSSTHGLAGDVGFWAYSASKHALVGIVKSLARELAADGIRVNAICPGPTRATGMSSPLEESMPEVYGMIARNVPLQRWAEPEEIAAVMAFLVSPEASFVNGVALPVDGGAIAGSGLVPPAQPQS